MDKFNDGHLKTVLIIGGNSMIGKYVVQRFAGEEWNVLATYSDKRKAPKKTRKNLQFGVVDLENHKSIKKGIKKILKKHSTVDVLINCAGIVLMGATEAFSEKQIHRQMNVNFLGVVNTIQEVLPVMRKQKSATIINISSLCGLVTFPMLSLYHGSKWALEGFTESIYYELEPFNIKVKLIEFGGVKEDGLTSSVILPDKKLFEYEEFQQRIDFRECFPSFSSPEEAAELIYNAAVDDSNKLRYIMGKEVLTYVNERQNFATDESYLDKMKTRVLRKE